MQKEIRTKSTHFNHRVKKLISLCFSSIFAVFSHANADTWTPLTLGNFSEGWTEEWVPPPGAYDGIGLSAPRHGWLNTANGFFTRELDLLGSYTNGDGSSSDTYVGDAQLHYPFSRRAWAALDVPFVVNQGDNTEFGDVTLNLKGMLYETKAVSISSGLDLQFATGSKTTGGENWVVTPNLAVWTDMGNGWSIRGGTGFKFLPETKAEPDVTFTGNLAIGQTITPHNAVLGDFTYYLSANVGVPIDSSRNDNVALTLTPGVRTHVADNFFLLAGAEFPVVNPEPFDSKFLLLLVKGF